MSSESKIFASSGTNPVVRLEQRPGSGWHVCVCVVYRPVCGLHAFTVHVCVCAVSHYCSKHLLVNECLPQMGHVHHMCKRVGTSLGDHK